MPKPIDDAIFEMALLGYEAELERIKGRIAAIREQLGGRVDGAKHLTTSREGRPRRALSSAAKKRIAAAQRRRWREFHAKQTPTAAKTAPKRRLSAARRAALKANLAKARAAKAAKAAA